MILSEVLEDLRDAHLAALDGSLWGADTAEVLAGPNGQRTRDAIARFHAIYNSLYRRVKEMENAPQT